MKLKNSIRNFITSALVLILTISSTTFAFAQTSYCGRDEISQWITATASILNHQNHDDHRMIELQRDNSASFAALSISARGILERGWNITNADGIRMQAAFLTTQGHNNDFMLFYEIIEYLGLEEATVFITEMFGAEVANRLNRIAYLGYKWGDSGIIAWDLFRVGSIVSWGYVARYIDREEALLLMEPAIALLQMHFSSWDEAVDNYLDGFSYWGNHNPALPNTDYAIRRGIYAQLRTIEGLFDDSLFAATPIVNLQRTQLPTAQLLAGYWIGEYEEGVTVTYHFGENATVVNVLNFFGEQITLRGHYNFDDAGRLIIIYNFFEVPGESGYLREADLIAETSLFVLSHDGSSLITVDSFDGSAFLMNRSLGL